MCVISLKDFSGLECQSSSHERINLKAVYVCHLPARLIRFKVAVSWSWENLPHSRICVSSLCRTCWVSKASLLVTRESTRWLCMCIISLLDSSGLRWRSAGHERIYNIAVHMCHLFAGLVGSWMPQSAGHLRESTIQLSMSSFGWTCWILNPTVCWSWENLQHSWVCHLFAGLVGSWMPQCWLLTKFAAGSVRIAWKTSLGVIVWLGLQMKSVILVQSNSEVPIQCIPK